MRSHRSLVLVVHHDSGVCVAQANDLTRAGYRCLVACDSATALWFAWKFALEVPALYPGIVLVSPERLPVGDLPNTVTSVPTSLRGDALVEIVGRASWRQLSNVTRTMARVEPTAPAYAVVRTDTSGAAACS